MKKTKIILIGLSIFLMIGSACTLTKEPEDISTNKNERVKTSSQNQKNQNINANESINITPSADTLSVALTLFRNKKEKAADVSKTFVKDDGVRLNISTVEKGYITVLYKGSSDTAQVIFPNKEFYNGKNEIIPNKNIIVPQKGWFFFDDKKGTETVYIIYSEENNYDEILENPERKTKSLDKLRSRKEAKSFITKNRNIVRIIELNHE